MFLEYEKDLDNSNQIIKWCEKYICDNKIKNDVKDKICGDNIKKDIWSEKNGINKNNSINGFDKNLIINVNYNQSNNYCGKKYQKVFYYTFYVLGINF